MASQLTVMGFSKKTMIKRVLLALSALLVLLIYSNSYFLSLPSFTWIEINFLPYIPLDRIQLLYCNNNLVYKSIGAASIEIAANRSGGLFILCGKCAPGPFCSSSLPEGIHFYSISDKSFKDKYNTAESWETGFFSLYSLKYGSSTDENEEIKQILMSF